MDSWDVDAEEPLLNLPVPLTPIHPIRQPGSFLASSLIRHGEITEDNNDNNRDAAKENQLELLRYLGKSYAANTTFWTQAFPLAFIVGVSVGFGSAGFLIILRRLLELWYVVDSDIRRRGAMWWLVINSFGGLLSGLLIVSPGTPKLGLFRTFFHHARDLRGNAFEAPFIIASSLILMATGAPLGPEFAVGSIGSGIVALLSNIVKLDRRVELSLVQAGLGASLAPLFLSPILGVSFLQELSVTGRRGDVMLDTVSLSEIGVPRDVIARRDHDWMEQISLGGTAATGAYVIFKLLSPHFSSEWMQINDLGEDLFEFWHLVAAIPVGICCGFAGALATVMVNLFRSLCSSSCNYIHDKLKWPLWIGILLFSTVGGIVHGLMSAWNPLLAGSGAQFVQLLIQEKVTLNDAPWLVATAFGKLLSMSVCIGFGLIGGPIFPMMFVGLCLGMAATPLLPISLAVPCCMCATVGSVIPIPFTLVFFISLSMSLTVNQISPVFISTLVAFTSVGGLGFAKKFGEYCLGFVEPEVDLSHWLEPQANAMGDGEDGDSFQYESHDEEPGEDHEDRAREIHNAVFGDARPMW